MNHIFKVFSAIVLMSLLAGCAQGAPAASPSPTSHTTVVASDVVALAQNIVDQLSSGNFAAAEARFDPTMAKNIPEAKLKDTWQGVISQAGAFKQQSATRTGTQSGYRIVWVTCQFEKASLDIQVAFNDQSQVSGLYIAPTAPSATSTSSMAPLAAEFINQMAAGDFAGAESRFTDTMKTAAPEASLKNTWNQMIAQFGAFKQQLGSRDVTQSGFISIYVTCQFANTIMDLEVTFNAQSQIAGFHITQPNSGATPTPVAYNPPAYVNSGTFTEKDMTIGSGEWAVPGTLSLPNGAGPFPGVVMVSGSGPNDRDETIGPNKPFRDIAWGLASQGVAVLRFDKRTLAHASLFQSTPALVDTLTVQEEFIDDALLAVKLLRQTPGVDPKRIFVLGHSEGAYVAPRIGQQDPTLAGLIMIAAPTRPLEDLVIDQYTYLFSLNGGPTLAQTGSLEAMKAQGAKVKDPTLAPSTSRFDLPLNIPAAYWLDLRGYQPAELAKTLSMPLMVLQGGRDYQVSATKDFPGWQNALGGKPNDTLKLYPALNHLLFAGDKPSTPDEYAVESHVSADIISDIAAWVLQH